MGYNIRNVIVNGLISSGAGGDVSALTSIVDRHTTEISALTSEVNRIENIGPTATDGGVFTTSDNTYNLKKNVFDIGSYTISANSDVTITPSGFESNYVLINGSYTVGNSVYPIAGGPLSVHSNGSGEIIMENNSSESITVSSGVIVVYYQETTP